MTTTYRLGDMAVTEVEGVGRDDSVRRAHALMDEFNVDQVPILNEAGTFDGVVTRRQLVHIRSDWGELRVRDVEWSSPGRTELLRSPNTPLDSVIEYLFSNDFVLITEDGERVMGIVTVNDVARFLYRQLS